MAGASGSRSPPKAFSKVLPTLCTAAFLTVTAAQDRDDRRPVIFCPPGQGGLAKKTMVSRGEGGAERIRCFPLEFADGEAGNFYQRGNKGLWRWKGWLVETIYSSVFFFLFGWRSFRGEDRIEVSIAYFFLSLWKRKVKNLERKIVDRNCISNIRSFLVGSGFSDFTNK